MRPTKYLGWSSRDRGLAEGLVFYESQLGPHGHPSWISQDPERQFAVDEVVDQAQAALDEAHEEYGCGKGPGKGVHLIVIDQGKRPD